MVYLSPEIMATIEQFFQLDQVFDQKSQTTSHYQYNSSGSVALIDDPTQGGPQTFYWNEQQWLSGVSNDLGVHHYVYDHKGERIMKSSVMRSSLQVNDQNIDEVQYLDPYTLYVNPYYVVTGLQGGDKVSKHYYMNTQRVATDISINYQGPTPIAGPQKPDAPDPDRPSVNSTSKSYNAAFADLQQTLRHFGQAEIDVNATRSVPTLEEYYPSLVESYSNEGSIGTNTESTTRIMFWYHPDYLGNVDLVTERDGKVYEFFTYNPWGEEMHQYNANTFGFSSPYRFNSKEKDAESGLSYYGARYYNSKVSVWMSVDPLTSQTLEQYQYTGNNPIAFIDPDGKEWEDESDEETAQKTVDIAYDRMGVLSNKINKNLVKANKIKSSNMSPSKKEAKLARLESQNAENMAKIDALLECVAAIDDMANSSKIFNFRKSFGSVILLTWSEKKNDSGEKFTVITVNYGSTANRLHEVIHGGQAANDLIRPDKSSGSEYWLYSTTFTPAMAEVNAYKAQYAYDSSTMPLSSVSINSISEIDLDYIKSIYIIDELGNKLEMYPR